MSDLVIVAIVAAIPGVLNSLVSMRNSRKLDVIHTLTNSNLTAVKNDLAFARAEITGLRELIKGEKGEK